LSRKSKSEKELNDNAKPIGDVLKYEDLENYLNKIISGIIEGDDITLRIDFLRDIIFEVQVNVTDPIEIVKQKIIVTIENKIGCELGREAKWRCWYCKILFAGRYLENSQSIGWYIEEGYK
jgi:hypothetical protein